MDSEYIRSEKKALRRKILEMRDAQTEEDIVCCSAEIEKRLTALDEWKKAEKIFFFYGYASEVRTEDMMIHALSDGKRIFIPRVMSAEEMCFFEVKNLKGLVPDRHGIPEPPASWSPTDEKSDLIIIPGVAFDRSCYRLGYGRGYYDRFLSIAGQDIPNVALAYELQMVDKVPRGEFDLPVDKVITEKEVIESTSSIYLER